MAMIPPAAKDPQGRRRTGYTAFLVLPRVRGVSGDVVKDVDSNAGCDTQASFPDTQASIQSSVKQQL